MHQTTIRALKPGEYFTLRPLMQPTEYQVYIRGQYDRSARKYECGKFSDISYSRLFAGDKIVYVGFTF